jgi:hypothetical protein
MLHIEPGKCTSIVMEKVVTTTLRAPYGKCKEIVGDESILVSGILKRGFLYRKAYCLIQCNVLYTVQQCKCRSALHYDWFNTSCLCKTKVELDCIESVESFFAQNAYAPDCEELCPLECEITSYTFTLFTSDYPTHAWATYLSTVQGVKNIFALNNQSFSYETLKNSAVCVDIYFNSLHYTAIMDSPSMSSLDLVCNFGGLLGLFLGMSLLSVVEYVEIVIHIASIMFSSSLKKVSGQARD